MPTIVTKQELLDLAGHKSRPTSWLTIDQDRVDQFADATGDHQFIHVDPVKAARTPLGGTVAHGYLTLSLLPMLSEEIVILPQGLLMAFNYGLDKLRFPTPVKVGSEVRLWTEVLDVIEKNPGQILVKTAAMIEVRGEDKPGLVAETLTMFVVG